MLRKSLFVIFVCFAIALGGETGIQGQPAVAISTLEKFSTSSAPTSHSNESSSSATKIIASTTPSTVTTTTTTKTTTSPTTPTTPKSIPTSPAPPTTTLAPPTKGHYVVLEGNETCLMVDLAIQISLTIDNKTNTFDYPANVSTNGSHCTNMTDELHLSWQDTSNKTTYLTFVFAKNESKYMVSLITLIVPGDNNTVNFTSSKQEFSTSVTKSYRCDKQQEIELSDVESSNSTYAVLKVSHVQFQAFHASEDGKYAAAEDCADSNSPDIVPIAVGCALVVLIVVVLIAYLVGRRGSQARGYLSM